MIFLKNLRAAALPAARREAAMKKILTLLLAGCGALILWDLLRARRMDAR